MDENGEALGRCPGKKGNCGCQDFLRVALANAVVVMYDLVVVHVVLLHVCSAEIAKEEECLEQGANEVARKACPLGRAIHSSCRDMVLTMMKINDRNMDSFATNVINSALLFLSPSANIAASCWTQTIVTSLLVLL
jgi:hypothetical protein